MNGYTTTQTMTAAQAEPAARATFIRRTYLHLGLAIAAFVGIEAFLLQSALAPAMLQFISANKYGWLMVLGGFILVGWLARGFAANVASVPLQYLGLMLYVVAEAIIFVPILYIAIYYASSNVLPNAAILTLLLFAGLTITAFTTRTDFSFMRGMLVIGGFLALGLIVCGTIFGFELGLWFSVGMVVLASAAILYDTSKIMYHYPPDRHVAAALELFASVALLFWYVLRILLSMQRR